MYVCALGVVLLNVANADANADRRTEMVSVSKVPLAVRVRKAVSAANAFEHTRFQINFPCCLLGRKDGGYTLILRNTMPTCKLSAYFALLHFALKEQNKPSLRLLVKFLADLKVKAFLVCVLFGLKLLQKFEPQAELFFSFSIKKSISLITM